MYLLFHWDSQHTINKVRTQGLLTEEGTFFFLELSNNYYSEQIKHGKSPATQYTELSVCLVRGRPDFGQILLGG
jgi:hypothetical protein